MREGAGQELEGEGRVMWKSFVDNGALLATGLSS